jgi:hypothetical protein
MNILGLIQTAVIGLAYLGMLHPELANAQSPPDSKTNVQAGIVPPDIVRVEKQSADAETRYATVGNDKGHYWLFCNAGAAGCINLQTGKNYLLVNSRTRWKMPGAKEFMTLAFIQDWTVKYNKGENIGLIPEGADGDMGMFLLDTFGAGYQPDKLFSDGPIQYGTGLSEEDRTRVWGLFFMKMIQTLSQQQGKDALESKLAKRCEPGKDYCFIAVDAQLPGVGGAQEPRKVMLIVAVDPNDVRKQLSRIVCIQLKDRRICRDWDTGKLMMDDSVP